MGHRIEIEKNVRNGCSKKTAVDGILYPSVGAACRGLGVSPASLTALRKRGMSCEEALSYAMDHTEELEGKRRERAARAEENRARREHGTVREGRREQAVFMFQGRTYGSFRRAVEDLSWENGIFLSPQSIKASAKKNGRTLEEQLALALARHLARKEREDRENTKRYGPFRGSMMMGEIYHEALRMVLDSGLSGLSDGGAAKAVAERAGIPLDGAAELIGDLIRNEEEFARFDYENREKIRLDEKRRRYGAVYGRHDWPEEAATLQGGGPEPAAGRGNRMRDKTAKEIQDRLKEEIDRETWDILSKRTSDGCKRGLVRAQEIVSECLAMQQVRIDAVPRDPALDEAIARATRMAEIEDMLAGEWLRSADTDAEYARIKAEACKLRAEDHKRMAGWLKELREHRAAERDSE